MIRDFIRQYRTLLIAVTLVLVGLHLVSSSIDDPKNAGFFGRMVLTIYEPIYKMMNYPFAKAGGMVTSVVSLSAGKVDSTQLMELNQQLQKQVNDLSERAAAADRYEKLLELKETQPKLVTYARIIARPPSGEYRVMVIDKGSSDGIKPKMAVITEKGLVGHVFQTSSYASKILLITDANSSVPAVVQRTRSNTIVEGQSTDKCALAFLHRSEDIGEGDIVVTSGLGGIFPKGLIIGSVTSVTREDFGIFLKAEVQPTVNLDLVEEVALLQVEALGAKELLPKQQ